MFVRFQRALIIIGLLHIQVNLLGVAHLNHRSPYTGVLNTIPKCGTNLIKKALWLLMGKNGPDVHSHFWPEQKTIEKYSGPKYRVIYMVRDPRDMLISYSKWILSCNYPVGYGKSFDEMFEHILVNGVIENIFNEAVLTIQDFLTFGPMSLYERYKQFTDGWITCPNTLVVRFEDLVGVQGGGSAEVQKHVLLSVGEHLGMKLSEKDIYFVQQNLFGGTPTFREGIIGGWKNHFTPERKALFKQHFPTEYLIELGYETDYNW